MSVRHGRLQKHSQIHAIFQQAIVEFIDWGGCEYTLIKGFISCDKPSKPIIIEGCECSLKWLKIAKKKSLSI